MGSMGIGSLKIDNPSSSHHHLFWINGHPQEAGRYVLCRYDPDAQERSDRNAVDVTPKDCNVHTRVHEYGRGAAMLGGSSGDIFYSAFKTQRLMKLDAGGGGEPESITPDDGGRFRFADGVHNWNNRCVIFVWEVHKKPAPADLVNQVVAVDVDGSETTMQVLATGNDFYAPRVFRPMAPRWHT
jgi:hypothetical protein